MNSWTFTMNLAQLFFWFSTATPSEIVALTAAFLVLVGVAGEEVVELPKLKNNARLKARIKRWAILALLMGLTGDILGVVMGQAEMAALTEETGGAATLAKTAHREANAADEKAKSASTRAGEAETKADAADAAAGKAQEDAKSAGSSATHIGELEAQLRADIESSEIILAATTSGHIFRPLFFAKLKSARPIDVVITPARDEPETRLFVDKLIGAFAGINWHAVESNRGPQASGIVILNKWVSMPPFRRHRGFPEVRFEVDSHLLARDLVKSSSGLTEEDAWSMVTLSLALGAELKKFPDMDGNSLHIVLGEPDEPQK